MKHIKGFLNTPPLWKKEQFGLKQFKLPLVDLKEFSPQPIPTNLRLGHQIEYIFKQILEQTARYDVLAHNIQIKKGQQTIGELDFLVEDRFRESKPLHIELTYKFYIIDPSISEPIHRLMGPNRKDMFFTKMEKTRDKQLPLIYTNEGKAALQNITFELDELIQETCYLGQLFIPYKKTVPSIRPLNFDCVKGFWVDFETFSGNDFKSYTFYIPHKYEWLHDPHEDVAWQGHYDIVQEINIRHINHRAPLIWMKDVAGKLSKGFVVWW